MNTRLLEMTPSDVPTLNELCFRQIRAEGSDYAPPKLFTAGPDGKLRRSLNIPFALKLIDTDNGRMVGGYIFERSLELLSFGTEPRATAIGLKELPAVMLLLEDMGYEGFHSRVPLSIVDCWESTINRRLRMRRDDDRLAHFYRQFRETL